MSRGNQREKAREANLKKQAAQVCFSISTDDINLVEAGFANVGIPPATEEGQQQDW